MVPSFQTLFMPLEQGEFSLPPGRVLFLNAQFHPYLRQIADPVLYQPFAPLAAGIEGSGLAVCSEAPPRAPYALAIVHLPKQVEEAKYMIASALGALADDGIILVGAANDANGNRIEKWLKEAGVETTALTKHKARAVWGRRPDALSETIGQWAAEGSSRPVEFEDGLSYRSQPGLFSWSRLDSGTALLLEHLPQNLKGVGADFGAGLGILSRHVLANNLGLNGWHVCEADARALAFSKQNLADLQAGGSVHYHWCDLTKRSVALPPLDIVVMNPPFHTGKKTEPQAGRDFIRTASAALKKGGRLYMVANAQLPYEEILSAEYASFRQLAHAKGFKIIEAVK